MRNVILLNTSENTRKVEEEEKARFVRGVLEDLELDLSDIWKPDQELTVKDKIKLRELLNAYSIEIIDEIDGETRIFVEKDEIAWWKKPSYVLKKDLTEINPNKKFYLEMHIEYDSVFFK